MTIDIQVANVSPKNLGLGGISVDTDENAKSALIKLEKGIETVSNQRAVIGAEVTRLTSAHRSISDEENNLSMAQSRLRDVDLAEEVANMTVAQILSDISHSILQDYHQFKLSALKLVT